MPRKLKNIQIAHISLVKMAANKRQVILKSGRLDQLTVPIRKTDEELGVAYSIVYAPGELDAHDDHSDAHEIRMAAYSHMARGRVAKGVAVDHEHDYEPGDSFIAESWIVRKGDPLFPEDPEGSWAVGVKLSDDDLAAVKKGDYTGISMGGLAEVEPNVELAKGALADKVKEREWQGVAWAFADLVGSIINDPKIEDKKAAVQEAAQEVAALMKSQDKPKETPAMSSPFKRLAKALGWNTGADVVQGFNAEVVEILKADKPALADLDSAFDTANKAVDSMDDKAQGPVLKAAYDAARAEVEKRNAPAQGDTVAVMKATMAEVLKDALAPVTASVADLATRLEKVEKFTGGKAGLPYNGGAGDDPNAVTTI